MIDRAKVVLKRSERMKYRCASREVLSKQRKEAADHIRAARKRRQQNKEVL